MLSHILLLLSLTSSLLEPLEKIIRGKLLTLGCHDHCLLHRLLLVEILNLAKCDALHAAGGRPRGVAQDEGVVFRISAWFWRQIQNLGRLSVLHHLVVLHGEVTGHQV